MIVFSSMVRACSFFWIRIIFITCLAVTSISSTLSLSSLIESSKTTLRFNWVPRELMTVFSAASLYETFWAFCADFCVSVGDWANALTEQQSSKNNAGAKVFRDCRMTLRLIISTSTAVTDYCRFQFTHWEGRLWLNGVTRRIVFRWRAGGLQIFDVEQNELRSRGGVKDFTLAGRL